MYMCVHISMWRPEDTLSCCSSRAMHLIVLNQDRTLNMELTKYARLSGSVSPRDSSVSAPSALRLQGCSTMPRFLCEVLTHAR